MSSLNLKSGVKELASIRFAYKHNNKSLTPILHENTFRFSGDQNGEIYFEIANQSEFDLKIYILNTNKDIINKIGLLRPFQTVIIERNEILGCAMVLEEYITDKGKHLIFSDERSRYFGVNTMRFNSVFGATSSLEIGEWEYPKMNPYGGTVVCDGIKTRTEADGGGFFCDRFGNTSRALLRAGRFLEQVRFKETTTCEKFYASIKFDFGIYRYSQFSNQNTIFKNLSVYIKGSKITTV